jgi:RNA polymerase sigma-70 factor (sigma-E family)
VAGWSDAEFDAFVGARMGSLVRFAYSLTGDLGHAEDLVQTALVKVYLRSRRMVPDDPERYVHRAIINANLSRFRRHRIRESLVEAAPDQPESRSVEASTEQADAVRELLAGLSPRQRTVVGLRYCADLSEAEVAELLGVSAGTVKTLASRGLAKLRAKLDPALAQERAR